jgi:hypothetical protein
VGLQISIRTSGDVAILALGLNLSVSNAPNVCGLGGPFNDVSGGAGLGPNGAVNGFTGLYKGRRVVGGLTGGLGVGGGVTDDITTTKVTPIAGRKTTCQ